MYLSSITLAVSTGSEVTPTQPRLWLWGNLRERAGVLGLGRCMRLEPRGDYVRWALDMTGHPSSTLTAAPGTKPAEPSLDAHEMLEIAGPLNMVSNVFKNGRHGTMVTTRVEVCSYLTALHILILPLIGPSGPEKPSLSISAISRCCLMHSAITLVLAFVFACLLQYHLHAIKR